MIVEAFRAGTPVIARRLGPFPEIVGRRRRAVLDGGRAARRADAAARGAGHAQRSTPSGPRTRFRTFYGESVVVPQYLELVARVAARHRPDAASSTRSGATEWVDARHPDVPLRRRLRLADLDRRARVRRATSTSSRPDACGCCRSRSSRPRRPARTPSRLTFDDGYRNFATTAWPRLRDAGLPATLFVVTGRAGLDNRWDGRRRTHARLRAPRLGRARGGSRREGVTLGSHSRSHPRLPGVADDRARRRGRRVRRRPRGAHRHPPDRVLLPVRAGRRPGRDRRRRSVPLRVHHRAAAPRDRGPPRAPPAARHASTSRAPGRLEAWGTRRFRWHLQARALVRRVPRAVLAS